MKLLWNTDALIEPYVITIMEHSHLSGPKAKLSDAVVRSATLSPLLQAIAPQCLFIMDEVHKAMKGDLVRTAAALPVEIFRPLFLSISFLDMTVNKIHF